MGWPSHLPDTAQATPSDESTQISPTQPSPIQEAPRATAGTAPVRLVATARSETGRRSPQRRGIQTAPAAGTAVAARPGERRGRGCQTCSERKKTPVQNGHAQASERILTSTLYDRLYYEEHKRTGLDYLTFGDWQRDYGRWLVESLNLRGRRVLDAGCACGAILHGLLEAGADAEGFDLSDYMIQLGRRKWPHAANRLHVADASELSRFQNDSFDAIHSSQVAEHWPPEAVPKILSELSRVTSPGGLFFCSLDTQELFARQERMQETEDPTHVCIRPRAWWIEQLETNGWRDATADYEHILKSHPQSYLKHYDWDWWIAKRAP